MDWIEKWQQLAQKHNILIRLEELETIKDTSWPLGQPSLGESLSILAHLFEIKDVETKLPLGVDSTIWTPTGLKLIPSNYSHYHIPLNEFAEKIAINVISPWRDYSPQLNRLFRILQSDGLHGLIQIVSEQQLKQWRLLRPIIPEHIEQMAKDLVESSHSNLITFTGIEGENERLLTIALIKVLKNKDFIVITVPAGGSYQELVEGLLNQIVKLIPRNVVKSILRLYNGNIGRILEKYTNIRYKGNSGLLIPQMEGYWIGLTIHHLLNLLDKKVAVIFENYINSDRKRSIWDALIHAKNGIFIRKDPNGIPIFPLMDPEDVNAIIKHIEINKLDNFKLYALGEGKTSGIIALIRILHYINPQIENIPDTKEELINQLTEILNTRTIRMLASIFGQENTEAPVNLIRGVNQFTDLLHVVESGLLDIHGSIAMVADNKLFGNLIDSVHERLEYIRILLRHSGVNLPIIYFLLKTFENQLDPKIRKVLLKLSGCLLHKLEKTNLTQALELAWEMEKYFGDLLIDNYRFYLLIGHVFMLSGRRERGYEIFSAVRAFAGSSPWILTHIMYYSFPMLTNGIGWKEIYEELQTIKPSNNPCIEFLITDSMIRYKLRENLPIPDDIVTKLHNTYKYCSNFIEHTFRYRDTLIHIYSHKKQYNKALSEAIKLKDAFTETEPYLLSYGMYTTGIYLILSGENLWLAIHYLERAFENFVYYYNVEAFLAIGTAIQWKAQLININEFEEYINTILALIDMEGLILYDKDFVYLSIAIAYKFYKHDEITNNLLQMVSKEVIFGQGGDITRASIYLYQILTQDTSLSDSLPYSEYYARDMYFYQIKSSIPHHPHLIAADMLKSNQLRIVEQNTDTLDKLARKIYKNGFKLLAAYIFGLIGKKFSTSTIEIANFYFRKSKYLFDLLKSKWESIILDEIEWSDPFYALAIKTALDVKKGATITNMNASELLEIFTETIRIIQSENEMLEQIILLIESFTGATNPFTAALEFINNVLTIWGIPKGWLYLEVNNTPKLWIHINIQGSEEDDYLMLPITVKSNLLSKAGNFVGIVINEQGATLKMYIESDKNNAFNKNHIFILSRSAESLLHFILSKIQ